MRVFDIVRITLHSLTRHTLRSVLAVLGVSIGVGAFISSVAVGEGASKQIVLELFRGWQEPLESLIESTPDRAISRMDNYGGTPLDHWGTGRETLLGDAAHPTTIDVGQGACQAIEDAAALRRALSEHDDPAQALRSYERRRIARTSEVMKVAWQVGTVGQWKNPLLARARAVFMGPGWDRHIRKLNAYVD